MDESALKMHSPIYNIYSFLIQIRVPKVQQYLKWIGLFLGGCGIMISGILMLLAVKSSNKISLSPNLGSKNGVHSIDKQVQSKI